MTTEEEQTSAGTVGGKKTETGDLTDRIWRTVSNKVRSVGSGEERMRTVIQNMISEETVKAIVANLVPKDAMSYAVRTIDGVKDEVVAVIGRQLNDFLQHVDLGKELQKILTSLSLEVRAEVRFIPNDKRLVKPEVKAKVGVHVIDEDGKAQAMAPEQASVAQEAVAKEEPKKVEPKRKASKRKASTKAKKTTPRKKAAAPRKKTATTRKKTTAPRKKTAAPRKKTRKSE
tara:strand:+ start:2052 stop:2741 length:690 start_codon:yes stop_codon:yes gene_type:complete